MAVWVEHSGDLDHGGSGWEYGTCLWAPEKIRYDEHGVIKEKPSTAPGHTNLDRIEQDDVIIHFRKKTTSGEYFLDGFSYAKDKATKTSELPQKLGDSKKSTSVYRVELVDFTQFDEDRKVSSSKFFTDNFSALKEIKERYGSGANLFYTYKDNGTKDALKLRQGYCFKADEEIWQLIKEYMNTSEDISALTRGVDTDPKYLPAADEEVPTGTQERPQKVRKGQKRLRQNTLANYGSHCCVEGCTIDDPNFLRAAHIERWADNDVDRGKAANLMCLCVFHDVAFENGYFYVESDLSIVLNPKFKPKGQFGSQTWAKLEELSGKKIIPPKFGPGLGEGHLKKHRERVTQ